MKKTIKLSYIIRCAVILFATSFLSCDATNDLDPGGTAVQEMAGDWFVELLADDGTGSLIDIYGIGYFRISTYNTSANTSSELYLDDHGLWPMKSIVNVDLSSKTFSGSGLSNDYDETITSDIMNGFILSNAATTTGGNVSDSIYFKVEYSDDPGTEYFITGYKRTGFLEDEH